MFVMTNFIDMHSSGTAGSTAAANKRTTYWKMPIENSAGRTSHPPKHAIMAKSQWAVSMEKLLEYFLRYRVVSATILCCVSILLHHSLGSQADVIICTYLLMCTTIYILADTLHTIQFLLSSAFLIISTLTMSVFLPSYILHGWAPVCLFAIFLSGYDLLSPQSWILGTLLGLIRSYLVSIPRSDDLIWSFDLQSLPRPPMHDVAAACCIAIGLFVFFCNVLFPAFMTPHQKLLDIFSVALPKPPVVTIKDIGSDSLTLYWSSEDDIQDIDSPELPVSKEGQQVDEHVEVAKHVIEMNGVVVGESEKKETSVAVTGLSEDTIFRLRVWAVTQQDWRTPSDMIVVRTRKASVQNGSSIQHKEQSAAILHQNVEQDANITASTPARAESPLRRQSVPEHIRIRIIALQAHLNDLGKQSHDLHEQISQFSHHHNSDSGIVAEAESLRNRKRQEDEARSQVKHQSKNLDDRKRALESDLAKVERSLKIVRDAKQSTINNQHAKAKEIETLKDRMITDDARVSESNKARETTTATLQEQIEAKKAEISNFEELVATLAKNHRDLDEQVRQVQTDIDTFRSSVESPSNQSEPAASEETFHYAEGRYHIAVEKYSALEAQHRQLQSNLMAILQLKAEKNKDLHRLRRWAEMDRLAAESSVLTDNTHREFNSPSPIEEPDVFADAHLQKGIFARRSSSGTHHGWPTEADEIARSRSFTPPLGQTIMRRRLSPRPRNTLPSNLDLYSDSSYSLLPSTLMSDVDGPRLDPPLPSPLDPASALTRRVSPSSLGSTAYTRHVRAESPLSSNNERKLDTPTSFPDLLLNPISTESSSKFSGSGVFAPPYSPTSPTLTSPISRLNGIPFQRSTSPVQKHHIPDALRAPGSIAPGRQHNTSPDVFEHSHSDPVVPLSTAASMLNEQPARNSTPPISQVGGLSGTGFGLWDSPFKASTNGVWNPPVNGDGHTRSIWQERTEQSEPSE